MPPKYIDVDKLISDENEAYMSAQIKLERGGKNITALINRFTHEKLLRILADAPIEDAAPVVHGEWLCSIEDAVGMNYSNCGMFGANARRYCSKCGKFEADPRLFCPWCGAKMDEDE